MNQDHDHDYLLEIEPDLSPDGLIDYRKRGLGYQLAEEKALKSFIRRQAFNEENEYRSWQHLPEKMKTAGRIWMETSASLLPRFMDGAETAVREEYAGWMSMYRREPDETREEMISYAYNPIPSYPSHWPTQNERTLCGSSRQDAVFGNLGGSAKVPLRLALAHIAPNEVYERAMKALTDDKKALSGELPLGFTRSFYSTYGYSTYVDEMPVELSAWPYSLVPIAAIALAHASESNSGLSEPMDFPHEEDLNNPVFQVERALIKLRNTSGSYQTTARREDLQVLTEQESANLLEAVPWFLALNDPDHDRLVTILALRSEDIKKKLVDFSQEQGNNDLGLRARGLSISVTTGEVFSYASAYIWHLDEHRYSVPESLAAPTKTWLGDAVIEAELEKRIDNAVSKLLTTGLSEETEVTGNLVGRLVAAFEGYGALPQTTLSAPPVSLDITSTNSRTHEKEYGADLGIALSIDLPDRLKLETGHLVQVKQAENRESENQPPKWTIDRTQLTTILKSDDTATYWLLQLHSQPKVLSVSAKYLLGLVDSREMKVGKATIQYADVRSASTTLGSELVPLLLGLWIGDSKAGTVKIARGEDSRHVPAHILSLRVANWG